MNDYFAMGGYAAYVWSAYGVAALVLIALLVTSLGALKRRQADLALLEAARGTKPRGDRAGATTSSTDPAPEAGQ